MIPVIDLHSDVLLGLQNGKGKLSFRDNDTMHITLQKLKAGGVKAQAFAIFIDPDIVSEDKYATALEQVSYFKNEVLGKNPEMKHMRNFAEIASLKEGEIGAFLTLESVECIGNDLSKLEHLLDEGVLAVGMTWNGPNLACDGIGEPRGAGLSSFGREIITLLNKRHILVDVSHISIQGFWDVMEYADRVVASHSNAKAICGHRRNLSDDQIKALIEKGGHIHLVYAPQFVVEDGNAQIEDLLLHVKHIIALGGAQNLGLGSDFDGISTTPKGLEDAAKTQDLLTLLTITFGEEQAQAIASQNFIDRYVEGK